MNGVLLVDKVTGLTSHDIVNRARRLLGTRSVGHAGTLDPMASGLLILLVGEGTKISDYLLTGDKGYEVTVRLGVRTDSMDLTGVVLEQKPITDVSGKALTEEAVKAMALSASGVLELKVPMHSAVKVNGKKLYESAHKGEIPEEIPVRAMEFFDVKWLGSRPVESQEVTNVNGASEVLQAGIEFTVSLRCSKGSFIRAWANHVGESLGCGGTVSVLRRIESAPYFIEDAKTIDQLTEELKESGAKPGELDPRIFGSAWVPLAEALPHFERIEIEGYDATLLRNGQLSKGVQAALLHKIQLGVQPKPVRVVHREERRLLALLAAEPGEFYKIRRVFL